MEEMIKILKEELEIYREMLKISQDKTDIIVKDKVDELEAMTAREEEFVGKFVNLEKSRIEILKKISFEKGLADETPKIPELCKYFPDDKDELMSLRKEILGITSKVKKKTELNQKLIKNSLDYINFSVGFATGTNVETGIYGKGGNAGKGEAKKFFDIKL